MNAFVHLLKFIHVIFAVTLVAAMIYSIVLTVSKRHYRHQQHLMKLHRLLLIIVLLAISTGSLLIYPKNFTLHTPWIQTAYGFAVLVGVLLFLTTLIKRKFSYHQRWVWLSVYILLTLMLLTLVHGAVTKQPFYYFQGSL